LYRYYADDVAKDGMATPFLHPLWESFSLVSQFFCGMQESRNIVVLGIKHLTNKKYDSQLVKVYLGLFFSISTKTRNAMI
jgi:hypothetical protein